MTPQRLPGQAALEADTNGVTDDCAVDVADDVDPC